MAMDFVGTSLELLRREHPPAYAVLCSSMAGRRARLSISGESLALVFSAEHIAVERLVPERLIPERLVPERLEAGPAAADVPHAAGEPELCLTTDWATILDLVDAQLSITDAVVCGQFDLRGEGRELARFYDALLTYLRGAVRCPSFPGLLDRLRAAQVTP
jgi:hypothetical protein